VRTNPYPKRPVNWTALAAIAALLTVVVATLPHLKSDDKYRIYASGDYAPFSVPEFFDQKLKIYLESIDYERISELLGSERSSVNPDLTQQSTNISKYLEGLIAEKDIAELQALRSLWTFSVRNDGDREVTDLRLELPFEGYCALSRLGEDPTFSRFKSVIPIGSIRPGNIISVLAWSTSDPLSPVQGLCRINHPNGVPVDIEYPVRVTGVIGWAYKSISLQGVLYLILFLVIIYGVVSNVRRTRPSLPASRGPSMEAPSLSESQRVVESGVNPKNETTG
jgi:hypothetical protein